MKIRNIKTRLLTVLLTLCMVLPMMTVSAYAAETSDLDFLPQGVKYSGDYKHTYRTQVNAIANVSVKDSSGGG